MKPKWRKITSALKQTYITEGRLQGIGSLHEDGDYCFIGALLHAAGMSDEKLADFNQDEGYKLLIDTYGLPFDEDIKFNDPRGYEPRSLFWVIASRNDNHVMGWQKIVEDLKEILK